MKRITCIVLVLLITLSLAACGGGEENKLPTAPEGYQMYDSGVFAFAYPADWVEASSSPLILMGQNGGNNITVASEQKTDAYENMTVESYNATYLPYFSSMGISVSNVAIHKESTNGLSVVKITSTVESQGIVMDQTQFITTIGAHTYTVTVTEVTEDSALVENVFQTLHAVPQ